MLAARPPSPPNNRAPTDAQYRDGKARAAETRWRLAQDIFNPLPHDHRVDWRCQCRLTRDGFVVAEKLFAKIAPNKSPICKLKGYRRWASDPPQTDRSNAGVAHDQDLAQQPP
jgi:hypothetical protein